MVPKQFLLLLNSMKFEIEWDLAYEYIPDINNILSKHKIHLGLIARNNCIDFLNNNKCFHTLLDT